MKISNWQRFFNDHAPEYLNNVFTQNTEFEVEFIIQELDLQQGQKVIDIGCGTGRHSIPLAKYGVLMTAIDLSEGMLRQAEALAQENNVAIELIHSDAADFKLPVHFDHAICLCEGAMGLLGDDDDPAERDLAILANVQNCLKPGGKFLLTVLNGLKKVREHSREDVQSGAFDPVHMVSLDKVEVNEEGESHELQVREKGFAPAELMHLLRRAGFNVIHLWGGTAGSWNKESLDMDEYEIMIIAEKPHTTSS